jgi:hypothetical protein
MAVITNLIRAGDKTNEVTEVQKALLSLGAKIDNGELFTATTHGTYGTTTQAAVAGLLSRFGFQQPFDDDGNPIPWVFEAWVGRLLNIAVAAEVGDSAALQKAVRESFDARQIAPAAAPAELAWLARYAVIARDFTTARKIAAQIPDAPVVKEKVGPIVNLNTLQPPAPELLNPENYYTVLYDYVSRNTIKLLVSGA